MYSFCHSILPINREKQSDILKIRWESLPHSSKNNHISKPNSHIAYAFSPKTLSLCPLREILFFPTQVSPKIVPKNQIRLILKFHKERAHYISKSNEHYPIHPYIITKYIIEYYILRHENFKIITKVQKYPKNITKCPKKTNKNPEFAVRGLLKSLIKGAFIIYNITRCFTLTLTKLIVNTIKTHSYFPYFTKK